MLDPVLRQSLRPELIVQHWDDSSRLAASFKDGLVRPSRVVVKLLAMQRQNPLQQAIQELGRLAKTRHILSYVDDVQRRRRILAGLNRQERLHALARYLLRAAGALRRSELRGATEPCVRPIPGDQRDHRLGYRISGRRDGGVGAARAARA